MQKMNYFLIIFYNDISFRCKLIIKNLTLKLQINNFQKKYIVL